MKKNIQTIGLVGLLSGITGGCHNNNMIKAETNEQYSAYLKWKIGHEKVTVYKTNENPRTVKMSIIPAYGRGNGRTYFDYESDGQIDFVIICNLDLGTNCRDDESLQFSRNVFQIPIDYEVNSNYAQVIEAAQKDYDQKLLLLEAKKQARILSDEEQRKIVRKQQVEDALDLIEQRKRFREQQVKDALNLIEGK